MPCLCPISIPDKILRKFGVPDNHLLVPCGHCAGCARDRINDWFVRLWSTYQSCRSSRTPVWFFTATIDQTLWPGMTKTSPGVSDRVTGFVRSWNERFRYLNGGKMPLRFMCSEYGSDGREYIDKHGVQRVTTGALHFHGLLFGRFDVAHIQRGLQKTHGWVDFDLIRGPEAIRYTVKYATKDFSLTDPGLRSRVFCSPGIGDSSYYFGDSQPTPIVLINGFHYRTPRYFIDKQWLRVYGKEMFYNSIGSSILVDSRCLQRRAEIERAYALLRSERNADPSLRAYLCFCRERDARRPSSLCDVLRLYDLKQTGISHPLLRYYIKRMYDIDFVAEMSADSSFDEAFFITNIKKLINYERYQTFVPLSKNIPSQSFAGCFNFFVDGFGNSGSYS